jgi:hypothetical protein
LTIYLHISKTHITANPQKEELLPLSFLLQMQVVASKLADEIKFPHGDQLTKTIWFLFINI